MPGITPLGGAASSCGGEGIRADCLRALLVKDSGEKHRTSSRTRNVLWDIRNTLLWVMWHFAHYSSIELLSLYRSTSALMLE